MATARMLTVAEAEAEPADFRRHIGHISRQSLVFFTGTIFTVAAGYLFKVYLARVLGAEALGIYALGMTVIGLLGVFNSLGLPHSAVRFVAAYTATARLDLLRGFLARGTVLLLLSNLLLGGVVLLAGPWIAVRFYHTPALTRYLGLFVVIMLFGALNTFLGQVLAGYKDVARRTVITNFIGSPVTMALTVGLVAGGLGLGGYVLAQIASAVLVALLLVGAVRRLTPLAAQSLAGSLPQLEKKVVSFSAAALGVNFLEFLMAQADKVLIGFYLNARALGIYAVAAAIVAFVPVALQSVNQIFSPTIADLYARGQLELLGRIFQTLTKWVLGFTIPLAAAMIIFAPRLMAIFGRDFEAGWPILVIGTLGQLVNCGVGSVGYLLLMSGNQGRLIRVQAVMAVAMVLLNLLCIPRWGITGAAVAAAATSTVSNLWYLHEVRRTLGLSPYNRGYLGLLLPTAGTLVALVLGKQVSQTFGSQWLVIVVWFPLAYVVFAGVALARGLNRDDRLIARVAWARLRGLFQGAEVMA